MITVDEDSVKQPKDCVESGDAGILSRYHNVTDWHIDPVTIEKTEFPSSREIMPIGTGTNQASCARNDGTFCLSSRAWIPDNNWASCLAAAVAMIRDRIIDGGSK